MRGLPAARKMYRVASRSQAQTLRRRRDTGELMSEVLRHAKYRRRTTIVEPCFGELKERHGLKRFRASVDCALYAPNFPCIVSHSTSRRSWVTRLC